MNIRETECLLISDFTINSLSGYLENSQSSDGWHVTVAPFDQVTQVILQEDHECWSGKPDMVVVWTRPERVSPSFRRALSGEPVLEQEVVGEVEAFCDIVSKLENRVSYGFIPNWVLTLPGRGVGLIDLKRDQGVAYLLARMNITLMQRFSSSRRFYVLNTYRWLQEAGRVAYSPKSWYLAKTPFGNEVFSLAAKDLRAALRTLSGKSKKLIVVDLDGTLWGGILGEVGWDNLAVGGHDAFGEAFADFQLELKTLRRRGILLAISSKNDEAEALDAITRHPEMILRRDDFVSWRINWNDKAGNIQNLVSELNLGLDAVVFLDDNPVERARVREALPQVFVPDLPEDKLLLATFLRKLDCFDPAFIGETDRDRTQLYQSKRDREALRGASQSMEEWLLSLQTKVLVEPLNEANWDRALQLLNKTNQMNLRTRRLTDAELRKWVGDRQNRFWTLRVTDRFGDSGLVGLMSFSVDRDRARIVDFILSCRVMGRKIEEAMLYQLMIEAQQLGARSLEADYIPTSKNGPCLTFLERNSGRRMNNLFSWDVGHFQRPQHISLESSLTEVRMQSSLDSTGEILLADAGIDLASH